MGDIIFEYESLFVELCKTHGFNLFLGAGFSVRAYNPKEVSLPLGETINEELKKVFGVTSQRNLTLSQTCQKIRLSNNDALIRYLRDTYTVKDFSPIYNKVNKFPVNNIFTINIDNLVERIYQDPTSKIDLCDVELTGEVSKKNLVNLYKLHGSITYPIDYRLSFTETELHDLFIKNPTMFNSVSCKLGTSPCVFWGTSLYDSNTIQLLCSARENNKVQFPKWIVLYPYSDDRDELIENYHQLGFHVIVADTMQLIEYIGNMEFVDLAPPSKYIYREYRDSFPNNFVCNELKKSVLVRPIADFFYGAEPQISDVMSKSVNTTSYFDKAHEMILGNRVSLITGIPGCGKSTLMLQLALSDSIKGRKFWFNNMIVPEAERLAYLLKDDSQAIIFLDNLYNNLDAFLLLKQIPNIKVVTSERAINYEFIRSSLNITTKSVLDISDLNTIDIQKICQSMNRPSLDAVKMVKSHRNISLLEIVFFAYHSATVRSRISQYVKTLSKYEDPKLVVDLLELYTLVNYVSYCGVPASMDMLTFYFDSEQCAYEDIYYALSKMENILVNAEMEKQEIAIQDYFTMRSKLYSELSISTLPKSILQNVLTQFLERVSPYSIYRYDIFKKRAYDADLTTRAFNRDEGGAFYNKLIAKNISPYIKHQYALFLQRKNDIDEAWIQIDMAYTESKGRIFSIANTHAMIMFEKNISVQPNSEKEITQLKDVLSRSFSTLENCIQKDMRVNYHILIFSRNTIRYYEKFGLDSNSRKYICEAMRQTQNVLDCEEYIYRSLYREIKDFNHELTLLIKQHNL